MVTFKKDVRKEGGSERDMRTYVNQFGRRREVCM